MDKQDHLYLLVLEVATLKVGHVYANLPAHCTFMHRFRSELASESIAAEVETLLSDTKPIVLQFGHQELIGPKKTNVAMIKMGWELKQLHMMVYDKLNELNVTYTEPRWVGKGYVAHISKRPGFIFKKGDAVTSKAVCLVEVDEAGQRTVLVKFALI